MAGDALRDADCKRTARRDSLSSESDFSADDFAEAE